MGFFDWLSSFIEQAGAVQQEIVAVFTFLLNAMIFLFKLLYNILVAVANFIMAILRNVATFFKHLWENFFKGIFNRAFRAILAAHDWLEQHLGPIIKFLQQVRHYIDRIFNLYVRPFLNLLQHIRQVLLVFRLLHLKFATTLDNVITGIENKVAGAFLLVRGYLTALTDAVNLVVDPARLLRHPILIIALRRSVAGIFRAFTGLPVGYFFPSHSSKAGSEFLAPGTAGGPSLTAPPLLPGPLATSNFIEGEPWALDDGTPISDDDLPEPAPLDYFLEAGLPLGDGSAAILLFGAPVLTSDQAATDTVVQQEDVAADLTTNFRALVAA